MVFKRCSFEDEKVSIDLGAQLWRQVEKAGSGGLHCWLLRVVLR